jgi:hypothetical protein
METKMTFDVQATSLDIRYLYLTANGVSPGGRGTTIRHNTQITHIIQK